MLVNSIAILLIILIIWWFWLAHLRIKRISGNVIKIVVKDGVYTPAYIEINKSDVIILDFLRKDDRGCADTVIFHELDKQLYLKLEEQCRISLRNLQVGKYTFSCSMNMYQGEFLIK
jgi:plastocyanin domain-containing protein